MKKKSLFFFLLLDISKAEESGYYDYYYYYSSRFLLAERNIISLVDCLKEHTDKQAFLFLSFFFRRSKR
jgi:hypothetical protein